MDRFYFAGKTSNVFSHVSWSFTRTFVKAWAWRKTDNLPRTDTCHKLHSFGMLKENEETPMFQLKPKLLFIFHFKLNIKSFHFSQPQWKHFYLFSFFLEINFHSFIKSRFGLRLPEPEKKYFIKSSRSSNLVRWLRCNFNHQQTRESLAYFVIPFANVNLYANTDLEKTKNLSLSSFQRPSVIIGAKTHWHFWTYAFIALCCSCRNNLNAVLSSDYLRSEHFICVQSRFYIRHMKTYANHWNMLLSWHCLYCCFKQMAIMKNRIFSTETVISQRHFTIT